MEQFVFGMADLKVGTTDAVTGLGTAMVSVGKVYKDSASITEGDATETPIYSQQQPNTPVKVFTVPAIAKLVFSLMSTDVDTLILVCGGTKTTVDTVVKWHAPSGGVTIEKAFELTTTDGTKIEIPRGQVIGKRNFQVRDNGIFLIDVTVIPLASKVANVSSFILTQAA